MKKGLKLLILSDLLIITGFGLISPILAIFIKENLIGGSALAAGTAITVYLITKSFLEIPFGKIEDHHAKKKYLITGTFLIAIAPLGYLLSKSIWHLYFVQLIYGVGSAMAFPSFAVLFIKYLDKGKEAYEWGVYGTVVGFGTAITAFIGGAIAQKYSFDILFILTFIIALIGTIILFLVPPEHLRKIKPQIKKISKRKK